MKWFLIVVLIYISVMADGNEHLFMCLLAICVSLEKCLFRCFTHFNWPLFLLLNFMSSLYSLDTSSFQITGFAEIMPHSVDCLFIFLKVLFEGHNVF